MSSNGMDFARNWNVATSGNLKTISITINWNDKTSHSITLRSVVTQ
jgi:hypothetical protein